MAMVCPQCRVAYAQKLNCPSCGKRLAYELMGLSHLTRVRNRSEAWRNTPWGRMFVGISLGLGMHHVLSNVITATRLVFAGSGYAEFAQGLDTLVQFHGLEIGSVLLAGILTGAGQQHGAFLGAFVGCWCAIFLQVSQGTLLSLHAAGTWITSMLLLSSCGAAGGMAGESGWRPYKPVKAGPDDDRKNQPRSRQISAYDGPVAWLRVCMGVPIAVGGVLCANMLREMLVAVSNGKLAVESNFQADFVAWEISALAIVCGSAFAGATRNNGLKQGLFVGIGTATALLGIRLANANMSAQLLTVTLVASVCLSLAGGWFGSQLLPPVVHAARRRRLLSSVYTG
jgi:hypothetical protein